MFDNLNCTDPPATAATDAGVAGAGVILSFLLTALLSLLLSSILILFPHKSPNPYPHPLTTTIPRKLLLSLSDQQLLTGLAIQSLALARLSSLIPYHLFLVWLLGGLTASTHAAALLALAPDLRRDWVLRWLREAGMAASLALSCAIGVVVMRAVVRPVPATLPVGCVWAADGAVATTAFSGSTTATALSVLGTLAIMLSQTLLFGVGVGFLHVSPGFPRRRQWTLWLRRACLLLTAALAVGVAVRVCLASQAFGHPSVPLADEGEKQWGFGQLVGLLMLILPAISAVEILRGEMAVPEPLPDDEHQHPAEERENRISFQPNPFWGANSTRCFAKTPESFAREVGGPKGGSAV